MTWRRVIQFVFAIFEAWHTSAYLGLLFYFAIRLTNGWHWARLGQVLLIIHHNVLIILIWHRRINVVHIEWSCGLHLLALICRYILNLPGKLLFILIVKNVLYNISVSVIRLLLQTELYLVAINRIIVLTLNELSLRLVRWWNNSRNGYLLVVALQSSNLFLTISTILNWIWFVSSFE